MAGRPIKWTQELRKVLYARIVMEFGQYNSWDAKRYPADRRDRFNAVLQELATYFSQLTDDEFEPTAVGQQADWACTSQREVTNAGYACQLIMNKAAALEMGFLTGTDLSSFLSIQAERENASLGAIAAAGSKSA